MNILNNLKPALLVMSIIILLPMVSYALDDQGEHTSLSAHPNISDEDIPTYINRGTEVHPQRPDYNSLFEEKNIEKTTPGRE